MHRLALVRIGETSERIVDDLAAFLSACGHFRCRVAGVAVDPRPAFEPGRVQYDCRRLLPVLGELAARDERILGVAAVDLYSSVFTFVFGEAHLGGTTGLISLHRLDPRHYGLPADPDLLNDRIRKEAMHEAGHLLGLVHCRRTDCVMRFSGVAEEIDLKPGHYCDPCRALLIEGGAAHE